MEFKRLNAFGEEVGKPTDKPTSKIGQSNQRQVGVLYGHNGGGKVYNYLAAPGIRAGDIVTPEVTHPKSGKTYRTLGRVMSTRDALGAAAGRTSEFLSGKGILMKTIGNTDQAQLPGFQARKTQKADDKEERAAMRRLNPMGDPV